MDTMPDPKQDVIGCLDKLTELYGPEWVFLLIGAVRNHRGPKVDPVAELRVRLAQQMVTAEARTSGGDINDAIRTVGTRLGFEYLRQDGQVVVNTLANFAKLVRGITRQGAVIGSDEPDP